MYKGHWYDVVGKERTDLRAMSLDFDSLKLAIDEVMSVLPDTRLIVMNENLDWVSSLSRKPKECSFVRIRR
ncbi:hypothetical protein EOE69_14565 [Vibrio cholerae]|nr:hypothetical protein [Vibrio cholerae]EGR2828959.1 hypothetical protein [Vibrio cholerae]GHX71244.1 hypothetical protein VCSRO11_3362 [Vibrio cholerae]